jgi:hypothetical protein
MKIPCEEWFWILCWYRNAVRIYSDAAGALGVAGNLGFNQAWEVSEEARQACGRLRAALLDHEHRHGCQVLLEPNVGVSERSAGLSVRFAEVHGHASHRVADSDHQATPQRSFRTLAAGEEWR